MSHVVKYNEGERVKMKKTHPCGSDIWKVSRYGVDVVMHCEGCGHRVMLPRPKFLKAVKARVDA